jgi:hypothetical protein
MHLEKSMKEFVEKNNLKNFEINSFHIIKFQSINFVRSAWCIFALMCFPFVHRRLMLRWWKHFKEKLVLKRENHFIHNDMHTNVLSRIDAITIWGEKKTSKQKKFKVWVCDKRDGNWVKKVFVMNSFTITFVLWIYDTIAIAFLFVWGIQVTLFWLIAEVCVGMNAYFVVEVVEWKNWIFWIVLEPF